MKPSVDSSSLRAFECSERWVEGMGEDPSNSMEPILMSDLDHMSNFRTLT